MKVAALLVLALVAAPVGGTFVCRLWGVQGGETARSCATCVLYAFLVGVFAGSWPLLGQPDLSVRPGHPRPSAGVLGRNWRGRRCLHAVTYGTASTHG